MSIKVMAWYWDHSTLDGHQLLAMLALADWANDEGECFPSIGKLSQRMRRVERSAQRAISDLEDAGELLVYPGMGKGADGMRSSLYYLLGYREAAGIETPPMIVEAALHYRRKSRKDGRKGMRVRKAQAELPDVIPRVTRMSPPPGDTDVTPPGDTDVTPPGDTDVTPPGDTDVTQIHHIDPSLDPSYRSINPIPPPPPLISNDVDGGGGGLFSHHSNHQSIQNTNGHHAASVLPPARADLLAMRTLALGLIADNLPTWNHPERHVDACNEVDLRNLLSWLWLLERIRQAATASPYSIDAYYDQQGVDAYRAALQGIRDPIAYLVSRTGGGPNPQHLPANLTDADAAALDAAIRSCTVEMETLP